MGCDKEPTASPLPLWWSRGFPGEASQVGRARAWLAELLPACAPLDDLLLFTSELATNTTAHTRSGDPGGRFTVEVTWTPQVARVVVGDQGSDEVPASAASPDDQDAYLENGRGLLLIEAMAAAWGTAGDAGARWLWADVHWRSRGGPLPTTPIGSDDAGTRLLALRSAYPGTLAWYSEQSGQWHATPPEARDAGDTLSAPSPAALTHMLAARVASTASR
jgi:anti-sigma regulatory factor (Ser/Thr protein kinase)